MSRCLDECLIFHCAPALAGIKPSSLVSCSMLDYPAFVKELRELNRSLNPRGIYFTPVCGCKKRVLLLVYRARQLREHLARPEVAAFLGREGYPVSQGITAVLRHLRTRLAHAANFPHEVGVLLGYPVSDVAAFVRHRGRHCKLSGYWKVYGDPHEAAALFARYDRCREVLCRRLEKERSLAGLFGAA